MIFAVRVKCNFKFQMAPICPECHQQQKTRKQKDSMRRRHPGGPLLCNRCRLRKPTNKHEQQQPHISQLLDQCPSNNGIITITSQTAGRPRHLLVLPSADVPSSMASPRTLRRRAAAITTCIDSVSTKRKLIEQQEEDVAYQLAYCLKKPRTARTSGASNSTHIGKPRRSNMIPDPSKPPPRSP